jgi:hypothetical protein
MKNGRLKQPPEVQQDVSVRAGEQVQSLLLIEELEPRLTPDGPFGSSNNNGQPPGGQVGWGC